MKRIDAHHHLWYYDPVRFDWISDEMQLIRHDFTGADLKPVLAEHGFDGSVVVQADQSKAHLDFMLAQSVQHDCIKGIVGWVELQVPNIVDLLDHYYDYKIIKGFRHVLQGEANRALMLEPDFMRGIKALGQYNYAYDILIFPDQLKYVPDFVAAFPNQRFVIDHIAKPAIKANEIDDWKKDIIAVAEYDNVYCKISGMVTEADWHNWAETDFTPYLDVVVEAFGTNRIMYGSDWPVCLVAGSYAKMLFITENYFSTFSLAQQEAFFGLNAIRFYGL